MEAARKHGRPDISILRQLLIHRHKQLDRQIGESEEAVSAAAELHPQTRLLVMTVS